MHIFFTQPDIGHYIGLDRVDVIPSIEPVLETLMGGVPVYDTINGIISTNSLNPIIYPSIGDVVLFNV